MKNLFWIVLIWLIVMGALFTIWQSGGEITVSCSSAESYCVANAEAPSDFGRTVSLTGRKEIRLSNYPEPHVYLYLTLEYCTPAGAAKKRYYAYKESLAPTRFSSVSGVTHAYIRNGKKDVVASTVIR